MVKNIPYIPLQSPSIPTQFDLEGATSLGGAGPLLDFCIQILKLGSLFYLHFKTLKAGNATYHASADLFLLVVGRILGFLRPEEFHLLAKDPFLAAKMERDRLQDPTTLQRTLYRVEGEKEREELRACGLEILKRAMQVEGFLPYSILDLDSTVEIVYGEEIEGAKVGYNPKAHGRRSYRPLIVTEGLRKLVLGLWLREGNASDTDSLLKHLAQTCDALESMGRPVRFVRADCGFQGEETFAFYERREIGYACKIKKTSGILNRLSKQTWTAITDGEEEEIEVTDFYVQLQGWSKERKVVVVRRRFSDPKQMYMENMGWRYECIVTNLEGDPWAIAHFYNGRCAAENIIKELKEGYGIDKISTAKFGSNDADLILKGIAYNVAWMFRHQLLPTEWKKYGIRLLRLKLFQIPGVLRSNARRFFLRLASWFPFREVFSHLTTQLQRLQSG